MSANLSDPFRGVSEHWCHFLIVKTWTHLFSLLQTVHVTLYASNDSQLSANAIRADVTRASGALYTRAPAAASDPSAPRKPSAVSTPATLSQNNSIAAPAAPPAHKGVYGPAEPVVRLVPSLNWFDLNFLSWRAMRDVIGYPKYAQCTNKRISVSSIKVIIIAVQTTTYVCMYSSTWRVSSASLYRQTERMWGCGWALVRESSHEWVSGITLSIHITSRRITSHRLTCHC